MSPALAGGFLSTGPPGKPPEFSTGCCSPAGAEDKNEERKKFPLFFFSFKILIYLF